MRKGYLSSFFRSSKFGEAEVDVVDWSRILDLKELFIPLELKLLFVSIIVEIWLDSKVLISIIVKNISKCQTLSRRNLNLVDIFYSFNPNFEGTSLWSETN